jgi:hypothetical protein
MPTIVSRAPLATALEIPGLVVVDDQAVGDDVLDVLRARLRASRLLGESQLGGGFAATRGFGVACHAEAVADAAARVPVFGPFVDVALDPARLARLLRPGLLERAAAFLLGDINALYLNVLAVPPGAGVSRHVDATLGVATAVAGDDRPLPPRVVVVLYVDVPAVDGEHDDAGTGEGGGVLRLYRHDELVAAIAPRPGRLVVFRGTLGHEVTPVASTATSARTSCVAELYALPRRRRARLPRLRVQSHGFAEVLARLRRPSSGAASGAASEASSGAASGAASSGASSSGASSSGAVAPQDG